MKQKEHLTAFYLETLLLILVFISIILVLTQVFGLSKNRSSEAKTLTSAVCLAQNAAEAFAGADTPEELCQILNEKENASLEEKSVVAFYDTELTPEASGALKLTVSWEHQENLLSGSIVVEKNQKTVYTLDTAVYGKEEWQ